MSEFATFLQFGLRHILDVAAMDHILFLVALAAIYQWRDARSVLVVVTAFTIGHSITLALAVTGTLALPTAAIEFLIPVTIVVTGLANLAGVSKSRSLASLGTTRMSSRQERNARPRDLLHQYHRPILAGAFGLIHGAGFANYLKALFVNDLAAPLFGFNVGIEIGQIVVLLATAVALTLLDTLVAASTKRWPALAMRAATVSLLVVAVGTAWAVERSPW